MHSSPEFRSLKAKIRVLCRQRRIRLEEFMKTFDIHRVKKIKVEQFRRALDVSGLQLSPGDVSILLAKYRIPSDPSFVDYRRFCDLMDKVFTIKGLEAKPEFKASGDRSAELATLKRFSAAPVSAEEEVVLACVKNKLLAAVTTKGIVLKDVFHDFDRSNAGKVTKTQFVRDLLDIVELSPNELTVLLKAYSDDLDVYYRALHFDICPTAAGAEACAAAPRSPERRHFSAPAASGYGSSTSDVDNAVRELEASLSEIAARDRIRTKDFFVDFDPLRTGKCSEAQFRRCVKLCFASVSEAELDALVVRYAIKTLDTTKVDYIRFCQRINDASAGRGKHSSDNNNPFASAGGVHDDILESLAAATLNTGSSVRCTREVRGSLSDSEQEVHRAMLQRLSAFCNTRRILLKPSFQDFDRGRREHITVEQFFRVMAMFKLTLGSDNERRVLLKRYESAYGERFVNYVNFCFDLEHWDAGSQSVARPSSSHVGSEIISPTKVQTESFEETAVRSGPRSVPMLLRYVQISVKRDRVRLDEYYRDFDKLRHGKITAAQFRGGLNAAGLVLSSDEMDSLGDAYACEEVDSAGKHWIAWKAFVEDVDSVFTVKGLERAPRHDLSALQARGEQFGGIKLEMELTVEQERAVTRTVRLIKQQVDRQRLDIKPAFEDFDRSRQGFISATKFERVLSMFSLLPADATQARLLLIKFREQSAKGSGTTLTSICDVNYRAFLQAIDLSSTCGGDHEPEALVLPGSVAYRQEVYSTGGVGANAAGRRDARERPTGLSALAPLLAELRRQLSAKRIRIKEFLVEGDKLRTGEITVAKFHTALNRSGCVLTEADVQSLDQHFRSSRNADKIDWRAFLDAVDFSHDMPAPTPSCSSSSDGYGADSNANAISEQAQRVLKRLRVEVNHRRLHMKPYFQDYDHNKIGRVTKFQFAAVLDLMKVNLSPRDVQALAQQFAFRDGRTVTSDVNYLALIVAVDSAYSS